jgi:hypothetical protein
MTWRLENMFIIFIVYGGMELPSYDKITVSLRQVLYDLYWETALDCHFICVDATH